MITKRYQILIKGNVQRVGFRHMALELAKMLYLTGKALYIDDAILIEVEGSVEAIADFIGWCHTGPKGCIVESFKIKEIDPVFNNKFEIVHGVLSSESFAESMLN